MGSCGESDSGSGTQSPQSHMAEEEVDDSPTMDVVNGTSRKTNGTSEGSSSVEPMEDTNTSCSSTTTRSTNGAAKIVAAAVPETSHNTVISVDSPIFPATTTSTIQVANIAPQTTREQMQNLFQFLGKIDDLRLYPTVDIGMAVTSKICFIKFYDSACVGVAQHLTNTVFIDRALVIIPFMDEEIPEESKAVELLCSGTLLPGIADPKLPQHVTSQLEGLPPNQFVSTIDPKLSASNLPKYPPLPHTYDTRKIEEIRRTLMIANIDPELTAQEILEFFNQAGEVKYLRQCARDNDPLSYALVEYTHQPSILAALKFNGRKLGEKHIK